MNTKNVGLHILTIWSWLQNICRWIPTAGQYTEHAKHHCPTSKTLTVKIPILSLSAFNAERGLQQQHLQKKGVGT